jgi:L-ascorbate metabolism protein UlaG (beta-lactamase superfamily)
MGIRVLHLLGYAVGGSVVLGLALFILAWLSTDHFGAFGGSPDAAHLRPSPHFQGEKFVNAEPTSLMAGSRWFWALKEWAFGKQMRAPICPLPVVSDAPALLAERPASDLRLTWLGHSTVLVEIDGATVLTDPMWGERASPSRWVGPSRFHAPPVPIAALPRVDAVVVSHEHYDHLDEGSVRALAARGVPFHVPLGIGAHLAAWGIPAAQIFEHDWWQEMTLAPSGVRLVSTPARHFNGRGLPWRTGALWSSWSIVGPRHRVFFSGDTGPTESLREIARRLGPFDVGMFEIGQYNQAWGDIHLGPEGALEAHARLGAKVMLPIHWSTFVLAYHDWSEPAETLLRLAEARGVRLVTPRLGEPIQPTTDPQTTAWWRALPPIAAKCP